MYQWKLRLNILYCFKREKNYSRMFLINRFLIIVIIFTTYINNIKSIVVIVTIMLTHKNKCIPASNKRNVPLGGKKHVSKNVLTIADYDYPNYLFHICSMVSLFDAHWFIILLTLSVPVIRVVSLESFITI